MNDATPETTEAAPAAPAAAVASPGTLLRQARERAGLGAEDLAGQLKIARSTLEALERDDFAALSEPVYVRGYYRKIARLLGVPESDVIAAYKARSQPAPVVPAMRRIPLAGGVAAGTSRQHRGQGLWIGLGVAIAIALAVLFALTEREPPRRLATATPAPTTVAPAPAAAALDAPAVTEPAAPAAGVPEAPPAPAGETAAATPAAEPAAAAVPPTQLLLDFSEASFVRVEDSRQRTLAIGLVRGGERQALDGQPPYTVFLGNAHNVKVFFGGAPVDFSSHINRQNDTARFTVP